MKKRYLFLDYETYSEADLKTVGAWEYAVHPSTEILVACWMVGTLEEAESGRMKMHMYCPLIGVGSKKGLIRELADSSVILVAQNAGFERYITHHVLHKGRAPLLPLSRVHCTAAMAATHALPRDLDRMTSVLKLRHRKNPDGKRLITLLTKPRKPTKNNPAKRNTDPDKLRKFMLYCADDVRATREAFFALPRLSPSEREVWKINQHMNARGVQVDRALVKRALTMIAAESRDLDAQTFGLTGGKIRSANQRAAVQKQCAEWGLVLPNLQKQTIEAAIISGLATGKTLKLLKIRQGISKTSTAKFLAAELRTRSDGRLRELQMYHGASTGRDAGMGFQVHNISKPVEGLDVEGATEAILSGDRAWVRALYGDVMAALSSCVRGALMASPGHEIYSADFNAIELRMLFWMAHHAKGLQMLRDGEDLYVDQAAPIYKKTKAEIDALEREVGKRAVLGCGFQMGAKKFRQSLKEQYGMIVSADLAKLAVKAYRDKHHPVVTMWENLERAAIAAVRNPGKSVSVNRTKWFVRGKFLYCELPSGRRLAYFGPQVKMEKTPWGVKAPKLYFWGVDPKTKQWVFRATYGGHLTENVVQGSSRDVMMEAKTRVKKKKYIPLFSVHDEVNTEKRRGDLEEFKALMSVVPVWAKGLPLKVKEWEGPRYKKN